MNPNQVEKKKTKYKVYQSCGMMQGSMKLAAKKPPKGTPPTQKSFLINTHE